MGDEPVADPDAMWKPGYSAPAGQGEPDDPAGDGEPREWFANYGRTEAAAAAEPTASPIRRRNRHRCSPSTAWRSPPASPTTPRDRTARRLLVATLAVAVVAVGGVVWQIGRRRVRPRPASSSPRSPSAAVPTWIAELDTGHVTGVIGTRSTIVVLELVTNDLVGLSADSGQERWRVNAAPSHSIAQLEEVDGAAIVLVEESTGDRSIAAYDLESGERCGARTGSTGRPSSPSRGASTGSRAVSPTS